jgi:hypothetical protein
VTTSSWRNMCWGLLSLGIYLRLFSQSDWVFSLGDATHSRAGNRTHNASFQGFQSVSPLPGPWSRMNTVQLCRILISVQCLYMWLNEITCTHIVYGRRRLFFTLGVHCSRVYATCCTYQIQAVCLTLTYMYVHYKTSFIARGAG